MCAKNVHRIFFLYNGIYRKIIWYISLIRIYLRFHNLDPSKEYAILFSQLLFSLFCRLDLPLIDICLQEKTLISNQEGWVPFFLCTTNCFNLLRDELYLQQMRKKDLHNLLRNKLHQISSHYLPANKKRNEIIDKKKLGNNETENIKCTIFKYTFHLIKQILQYFNNFALFCFVLGLLKNLLFNPAILFKYNIGSISISFVISYCFTSWFLWRILE